MQTYSVTIKKSAAKSIEKLPKHVVARIILAIRDLSENPRPAGVKKLVANEDLWRIRVGDYRVVYWIEDDIKVVDVTQVAHRSDVYRKK